jgi:GSH-dependent disulfide-bond oxidoreductase
VIQWLMFQMGGIGPMFGQLGYFHTFAGKEIEDPRPKERYRAEAERLLKVLDGALGGRTGSRAAIPSPISPSRPGCARCATSTRRPISPGWDQLKHVPAYLDRFLSRPAVQRGLVQPPAVRVLGPPPGAGGH